MSRLFFAFWLLLGGLGFAEDLQTVDGRLLQEIKINWVKPCEVQIFHSKGVSLIETGALPDEFIKRHGIPIEQCIEFESSRLAAFEINNFIKLKEKKIPFVLQNGTKTDTSQIIRYNPARIIIAFPSGPRSFENSTLPPFLKEAIRYTEQAAIEYANAERLALAEYQFRIAELQRNRTESKISAKEWERKWLEAQSNYGGFLGGGGKVWVNGYTRRDGTYVKGHYRSSPR